MAVIHLSIKYILHLIKILHGSHDVIISESTKVDDLILSLLIMFANSHIKKLRLLYEHTYSFCSIWTWLIEKKKFCKLCVSKKRAIFTFDFFAHVKMFFIVTILSSRANSMALSMLCIVIQKEYTIFRIASKINSKQTFIFQATRRRSGMTK